MFHGFRLDFATGNDLCAIPSIRPARSAGAPERDCMQRFGSRIGRQVPRLLLIHWICWRGCDVRRRGSVPPPPSHHVFRALPCRWLEALSLSGASLARGKQPRKPKFDSEDLLGSDVAVRQHLLMPGVTGRMFHRGPHHPQLSSIRDNCDDTPCKG